MRMTNLHDVHTAGSRRVLGGFSSILGDSRRNRGGSWQVCCKLLAASRLLWLWRVLGELMSSSCRVLCELWSRSGFLTPRIGPKTFQNDFQKRRQNGDQHRPRKAPQIENVGGHFGYLFGPFRGPNTSQKTSRGRVLRVLKF